MPLVPWATWRRKWWEPIANSCNACRRAASTAFISSAHAITHRRARRSFNLPGQHTYFFRHDTSYDVTSCARPTRAKVKVRTDQNFAGIVHVPSKPPQSKSTCTPFPHAKGRGIRTRKGKAAALQGPWTLGIASRQDTMVVVGSKCRVSWHPDCTSRARFLVGCQKFGHTLVPHVNSIPTNGGGSS